MNILQICRDRTGGFLVWRIVQHIIDKAGWTNKSFIKNHYFQKQKPRFQDLPYDLFSVDHLTVYENYYSFDIDILLSEHVSDIKNYVDACSHIMSDSSFQELHTELFSLIDKKFYLVRDPRDSLASISEFMFKPYYRRYLKPQFESPADFIEQRLEQFMSDWQSHVLHFWERRTEYQIYFLRYEDLVKNPKAAIRDLALFFGVRLSQTAIDQIASEVSLNKMKKSYPSHVQYGRSNRFKEVLDSDAIDRSVVAGHDALKALGYIDHV